jgi:pimeloyl-ACP methyl ester carboxylesterase
VAEHPARGAVAAYLRKYVLAPRYARVERMSLHTDDGVRLAAARLTGPADAPATVVLVHGFLNWSRTPAVHRFARLLAGRVHVIVPDLRGHGRSGGRSALGGREALDVAAAVAAAEPSLPVVTLGVSLGGAAVILHAGTHPGAVAGVVAVSAPGWWGDLERAGASRVNRYVTSRAGRLALAGLLWTRLERGRRPLLDPVDVVGAIAPGFTVIVHDPGDHFFGPQHAERLHTAARAPKTLWWQPGAGHGVDLLTAEFGARVLAELDQRVSRAPDPWR